MRESVCVCHLSRLLFLLVRRRLIRFLTLIVFNELFLFEHEREKFIVHCSFVTINRLKPLIQIDDPSTTDHQTEKLKQRMIRNVRTT